MSNVGGWVLVGGLWVSAAACVLEVPGPRLAPDEIVDAGYVIRAQPVQTCNPVVTSSDPSPVGAALPLAMMTWNVEWFQDPAEGPADDAAQYQAVKEIIARQAASVVALQELASEEQFERLLDDLPGYAGILSGYASTQKTALLWQKDHFALRRSRAISGLDDAGRPPLEVRLQKLADATELLVVVIHAKAQADALSQATRERLAESLKGHLDSAHKRTPSIVLGDFNDLLVGSILTGNDSPYRVFLDDPSYAAPTRVLNREDATEHSYAFGQSVDHILVSDELAPVVDAASVNVLRDELLVTYPRFTETVSDHFPVTLELRY